MGSGHSASLLGQETNEDDYDIIIEGDLTVDSMEVKHGTVYAKNTIIEGVNVYPNSGVCYEDRCTAEALIEYLENKLESPRQEEDKELFSKGISLLRAIM